MENPAQSEVARLLEELKSGNRDALDELFPLVYDALRKAAHAHRGHWHGDYTLNTTALVHEAYLKLVDRSGQAWQSQSHFLAVASKAMRHILVDYARRRRASKRGGDVQMVSFEEMRVALEEDVALSVEQSDTLAAIGDALEKLERIDDRAASVVECKLFGGMTIAETAKALGTSPRTVTRDWAMAQAWLLKEIRITSRQ